MEHGRRFHAYKDGAYNFPNDDKEQDRLDMVHHIQMLAKDKKLFLAPLSASPKRILDVGTGYVFSLVVMIVSPFPKGQDESHSSSRVREGFSLPRFSSLPACACVDWLSC